MISIKTKELQGKQELALLLDLYVQHMFNLIFPVAAKMLFVRRSPWAHRQNKIRFVSVAFKARNPSELVVRNSRDGGSDQKGGVSLSLLALEYKVKQKDGRS